MWK
ncbi:hypothetical protein LINPERHAP1_LOCUS30593 [Linum perenne]|jgi:hypothetical protein